MTLTYGVLIALTCLIAAGALLLRQLRRKRPNLPRAAPASPRIVKIKLEPFPPLVQARLEIGRLASDPDLTQLCMFGGPLTSEMEEENERRVQEYHRRKLAIIKKYGVADAFLEPLLIQRRRLERDSAEVSKRIAELKTLRESNDT